MTLKQLEYVIRIVECNSITAAARELSVSQPGITKAIASLEEEFGIRLFERKSHGVLLTAEGREFVHYARGVLSAVDALETGVEEQTIAKKRLSVGTQQLDFIYPAFDSCYSLCKDENLFFNLVETERNDVVRQVLDGHVDLGLVVRTHEDEKDFFLNREGKRLETHVIDTGGCSIAVGPGCPLYGRERVRMEEALKFPQVALDMENQAKEAFWMDQSRYEYFGNRHIIFCNTIGACENFLMHSDAVAFTSAWTGGCFRGSEIQIIPVEGSADIQQLLWLKLASEPLSPMEQRFLRQIYETLGKPVPEYLNSNVPDENNITFREKKSI